MSLVIPLNNNSVHRGTLFDGDEEEAGVPTAQDHILSTTGTAEPPLSDVTITLNLLVIISVCLILYIL